MGAIGRDWDWSPKAGLPLRAPKRFAPKLPCQNSARLWSGARQRRFPPSVPTVVLGGQYAPLGGGAATRRRRKKDKGRRSIWAVRGMPPARILSGIGRYLTQVTVTGRLMWPVRGRRRPFAPGCPAAIGRPGEVKRQLARSCAYLRLAATLSLSAQVQLPANTRNDLRLWLQAALRSTQRRQDAPTQRGSGLWLLPLACYRAGAPWRRRVILASLAPFPLQNVKEQAPERRTRSILPLFSGNATKSFVYRRRRGLREKRRRGTPVRFFRQFPAGRALLMNWTKPRRGVSPPCPQTVSKVRTDAGRRRPTFTASRGRLASQQQKRAVLDATGGGQDRSVWHVWFDGMAGRI